MDDYQRLIMGIATNDVPRIHSIIETAMRNGVSIRAMANRIFDAFEGLDPTKGFTGLELDLGILIYRLGARSLLYAMNHALNLPSLRTICNSAKFIKITPTIAVPNTALRGVTIMMDECALEEQAVYFSHTNKVGGLCQKHSGTVPLTMTAHGSVQTTVNALGDGKVHFGKEMLFVAAKCRGESTLYPLLCAPTCKQETWEDFKALFNLLIDVWGEEAAEILKSVYIVLSNLPGLNLFTGPGMMLMTFDWRHVLKRKTMHTLASHIGCIVNPACLQRCLLLLPGQTDARVYTLLNPDDSQDVPRAILLLEAVVALRVRRVEFNVSPLDVDTNSDLDTITLLNFMLEAILNAFTDPSASLSDQIRNLSIYAHMSFAKVAESLIPEIIVAPSSTTPDISTAPPPQPTDPDFVDDLLPDPNVPLLSFEEALQSEETEPAALKLAPRTGVKPQRLPP
ncbi:hypothetical protein B0H14DRAFT_3492072 [Mycena olivaceomarginata]|nr:hypothetical protein B0H14DRAFT_3492072 [Mycena olivaceomarginata]